MKIEIQVTQSVDVKYILIDAGVRRWGNGIVNGTEDDDENPIIPFAVDGRWCPKIDLETGVIQEWPEGTTADIHYKICDDGSYHILNADNEVIASITDDYVPAFLCPNEKGYGDYIIMKIDQDGKIWGWKQPTEDQLKEFTPNTSKS